MKIDYNKLLKFKLFILIFANIVLAGVYAGLVYYIYKICKYGNLKSGIFIVLICFLIYIALCIFYVILLNKYKKADVPKVIFKEAKAEDDLIICKRDENQIIFSTNEIRFVQNKKRTICFYLTRFRFVVIDLTNISEYDSEYMKLKISQINPFRKINYQMVYRILILTITLVGAAGIYSTTINYNGALSWKIQEWKQQRKVKFEHDNIYKYELGGLFKSIDDKIGLPAKLMVTSEFQLTYDNDGKITSFETTLAGFDEHGQFVQNYLIYYDCEKSDKIIVDLTDGKSDYDFDEKCDFMTLIGMCKEIPFDKDLNSFGSLKCSILYYGVRNFGYNTDGIRYLDRNGQYEIPQEAVEEIEGPCVSVYVKGHEDSMTPIRYIYCDVTAKEPNVIGKRNIDGNEYGTSQSDIYDSYNASNLDSNGAEAQQEADRIKNLQVKNVTPQWMTFNEIEPSLYGNAEEKTDSYTCPDGVEVYRILHMDYQLYGETEAIKKINTNLNSEEEAFIGERRNKAESYKNYSQKPCIHESMADSQGNYDVPFVNYFVNRVVCIDSNKICLRMNENAYEGNGVYVDNNKMLTYSLDTGEKMGLFDLVDNSKNEIYTLINEYFQKSQGFYKFADGTTAADIWFENPKECSFYVSAFGVGFTFGNGVFPNQDSKDLDFVEVFVGSGDGRLKVR